MFKENVMVNLQIYFGDQLIGAAKSEVIPKIGEMVNFLWCYDVVRKVEYDFCHDHCEAVNKLSTVKIVLGN